MFDNAFGCADIFLLAVRRSAPPRSSRFFCFFFYFFVSLRREKTIYSSFSRFALIYGKKVFALLASTYVVSVVCNSSLRLAPLGLHTTPRLVRSVGSRYA